MSCLITALKEDVNAKSNEAVDNISELESQFEAAKKLEKLKMQLEEMDKSSPYYALFKAKYEEAEKKFIESLQQ